MNTNRKPTEPSPKHDGTTPQGTAIIDRRGYPQQVDADIVIPVYNEEHTLQTCIQTLEAYLSHEANPGNAFTWNIIIADNASTDGTWDVATALCAQYPESLRAVRIGRKGRGAALKLAWSESLARVVSYMDVDLSTDIRCTGMLIGSLLAGGADVSIGSRLLAQSDVTRSTKREFISRTYNLMLRTYLGVKFHDAQCGFKAMTAAAADALLPKVKDDEWFFDTELLVLAERRGMQIYEIPVTWVEDSDSRVNIPDTVSKDIAGMRRMRQESRKDGKSPITNPYAALGWGIQNQDELRGSLIELANVKVGA
ncbi:MAG: glycosyltransferase family 2 protein [Bifidobacterium crudilactis]|jgi:glycosyltransferase involved in cell wall biosynthesis|nr:glycosyltransferase family 2 protein [Bifidobacterium crudilactis]